VLRSPPVKVKDGTGEKSVKGKLQNGQFPRALVERVKQTEARETSSKGASHRKKVTLRIWCGRERDLLCPRLARCRRSGTPIGLKGSGVNEKIVKARKNRGEGGKGETSSIKASVATVLNQMAHAFRPIPCGASTEVLERITLLRGVSLGRLTPASKGRKGAASGTEKGDKLEWVLAVWPSTEKPLRGKDACAGQ